MYKSASPCYRLSMGRNKALRELATKNIRIYPSTLSALQRKSVESGKTIARIIFEAFKV